MTLAALYFHAAPLLEGESMSSDCFVPIGRKRKNENWSNLESVNGSNELKILRSHG